jgi:hypothetical protein
MSMWVMCVRAIVSGLIGRLRYLSIISHVSGKWACLCCCGVGGEAEKKAARSLGPFDTPPRGLPPITDTQRADTRRGGESDETHIEHEGEVRRGCDCGSGGREILGEQVAGFWKESVSVRHTCVWSIVSTDTKKCIFVCVYFLTYRRVPVLVD